MMTELGEDPAKIHLWREFDGTLDVAEGGAFGSGGVLADAASETSRSSNFYHSGGEFDVPDPWYGDDDGFYDTYKVVDDGAKGLVEFIDSKR